MIKSRYSGELKTGDFISVAFMNTHWLGFYLGKGSGKSIRYYSMIRLVDYYNGKITKLYFDFIGGNYAERRIMKILPDCLDKENYEDYEKAVKVLKELKVI